MAAGSPGLATGLDPEGTDSGAVKRMRIFPSSPAGHRFPRHAAGSAQMASPRQPPQPPPADLKILVIVDGGRGGPSVHLYPQGY